MYCLPLVAFIFPAVTSAKESCVYMAFRISVFIPSLHPVRLISMGEVCHAANVR